MKNNQINVHELLLDQAVVAIKKAIENSYSFGYEKLEVIHGSNHGKKIKTWCQTNGNKLPHVLSVQSGKNEGISVFYIELNLKNR